MNTQDKFINQDNKSDWQNYLSKLLKIGDFITIADRKVEDDSLLWKMKKCSLEEEKKLLSNAPFIKVEEMNKEFQIIHKEFKRTCEDVILLSDKLMIHTLDLMAN